MNELRIEKHTTIQKIREINAKDQLEADRIL